MTLTYEKLIEMARSIPVPRRPDYDLFPARPFTLEGRRIIEMPPPAPRVAVRDIKLKDGTPLLPTEFRAKINSELLERFGAIDPYDRNSAYLLGSWGLLLDPLVARQLAQLGP